MSDLMYIKDFQNRKGLKQKKPSNLDGL